MKIDSRLKSEEYVPIEFGKKILLYVALEVELLLHGIRKRRFSLTQLDIQHNNIHLYSWRYLFRIISEMWSNVKYKTIFLLITNALTWQHLPINDISFFYKLCIMTKKNLPLLKKQFFTNKVSVPIPFMIIFFFL